MGDSIQGTGWRWYKYLMFLRDVETVQSIDTDYDTVSETSSYMGDGISDEEELDNT